MHAIRRAGGSASNDEITDRVINDMELPAHVTDILHGDGRMTKLEHRLACSRTYLNKAGLIINSNRGVWSLTSKGRETKIINPQEIIKTYHETVKTVRNTPKTPDNDLTEGDPATDEADSWEDKLLEQLLRIPPDAFERLCQRLLRELGFIEVEVTGRSGDGGIDGQGIIRLASLISFPVVFQCKRFSHSVVPSVVRDFRGAMTGRADKGLIITTGTFTRAAKNEATRDGAPPIDLIDGASLVDLLRQTRVGVIVTPRTVEDVEIDSDFFNSL